MAYGDLKDLAKETASDKVLRDKAFSIAKNPKYGYQNGLLQWFINLLIKRVLLLLLLQTEINLQVVVLQCYKMNN